MVILRIAADWDRDIINCIRCGSMNDRSWTVCCKCGDSPLRDIQDDYPS